MCPLSVLDVSLPMDRQALKAFLLDPGSACTAAPHALPSRTRVVSDFLTAIGHAVRSARLLAERVPLFLPLRRVVDARMSITTVHIHIYTPVRRLQRSRATTAVTGVTILPPLTVHYAAFDVTAYVDGVGDFRRTLIGDRRW
jgi:hypothetical protein